MKKIFYLLMVVLAIVSCDPEPEVPKEMTTIALNRKEVTLSKGDSIRLSYTLNPAGANVRVTWSSSDESVLTVNSRGMVRAWGLGQATVTASIDGSKDECVIDVKSDLDVLRFTSAVMPFDPDTTACGGVAGMSGDKHVVLSLATFYLMSEGLYLDGEELVGPEKGAIIIVESPIWYAPKESNGGKASAYVTNVNFTITDPYETKLNTLQKGSIDEAPYVAAFKKYCEQYNTGDEGAAFETMYTAAECVHGARLVKVAYHTREEGYMQDGYVMNDLPTGLVSSGSFKLNGKGAHGMLGFEQLDLTVLPFDPSSYWGVSLVQNGGLLELTDEHLHFGAELHYTNK